MTNSEESTTKYRLRFMPEALQGLVYQVEDGELVVLVLAVDKREDMAAYKSAVLRLLGTTH